MATPPPCKNQKTTPTFQRILPRYTSVWSFIVKSKLGDTYAHCKYCKKDFQTGKSGEFDFKRHNEGLKHKQIASSQKLPSVASMFSAAKSSADQRQQDLKEQAQKSELILINLIAEMNLPISTADKFTKAIKEMCPDSQIMKEFSCSRTKATAVAKDMAKIHQNKLFKRMQTGPFTISTDGSNDQRDKLYPIVVRTIHPDTLAVESELLSLPVCEESARGENIFKLLDTTLHVNGISWNNCLAFGSDNASLMSGIHKGVYAFIREKNPEVFFAGCTLHLVHIAAEKASDNLPFSHADLLTDIHYYFNKSSTQQKNLSNFQSLHNKDQKKMLKHVATRWLSMGKCLERLLDNWAPLKSFFQPEKDDKKKATSNYAQSKVKLISDKLNSNTAKLYTHFLKYRTGLFEKFLTANQSSAPRISKLRDSMMTLLKDILKQFVKPSAFGGNKLPTGVDFVSSHNVKDNIDILIGSDTKDFLEKKSSSFSEDKLKDFYGNVVKYYQQVAKYLKDNLPFDSKLLMDLSITDPDNITSDSLLRKVNVFMTKYPVLLNGYSKDQVLDSFTDLQIIEDFKKEDRDDLTWAQIAVQNDNYKPACLFLLGLLTIPHGSAHCERVFSRIRKNRTEFRPNLGVDTLEAFMVLKHISGGPSTQTYTPKELQFLRGSTKRALLELMLELFNL